jgi:hypothetical protein
VPPSDRPRIRWYSLKENVIIGKLPAGTGFVPGRFAPRRAAHQPRAVDGDQQRRCGDCSQEAPNTKTNRPEPEKSACLLFELVSPYSQVLKDSS